MQHTSCITTGQGSTYLKFTAKSSVTLSKVCRPTLISSRHWIVGPMWTVNFTEQTSQADGMTYSSSEPTGADINRLEPCLYNAPT